MGNDVAANFVSHGGGNLAGGVHGLVRLEPESQADGFQEFRAPRSASDDEGTPLETPAASGDRADLAAAGFERINRHTALDRTWRPVQNWTAG